MTLAQTILAVVGLALLAFILGIRRSKAFPRSATELPHSRPRYHGGYLAILVCLVPLIVIALWSFAAPRIVNSMVERALPPQTVNLTALERNFALSRIDTIARAIPRLSGEERQVIREAGSGSGSPEAAQSLLQSKGVALGAAPDPFILAAADGKAALTATSNWLLTAIAAALALLGLGYGLQRQGPQLRARNFVERVVTGLLMAASGIAILTTFGIVISVVFESLSFFQMVPPSNFFFGTVWDPRFAAAGASQADSVGQFGLIPLLWGTLFISFVALAVAVPIGLLSAIYMSEYASSRFRSTTKPLIEILAGIPTIVYGFFALVTFGPMLRDAGASVGLSIAATSVLSAGVVMGVMIIPFVSSLSDDIINAVPQSLRDGSYALGATRSETIKQVVMPAALPGIVGAILLAASRAIGETMIVVLAAGIAANITFNPFESVTTMTVKIVSQLTGDLEFTSPQTLVAFALGLTLFVITLGLNVYALYVVRKYREQYE